MVMLACAGLAAAACGAPTVSTATARAGPDPAGTADVAYAGSLASLNEKVIGPAFSHATGYTYQGRGAGSKALSQEIAAGEISPNVFESVGAKPIEALGSKQPGWYVQFAASPIVVAYSPSSPYAGQLRSIATGREPLSDLFTVMAKPGFKLGRTDPNLDPQGEAFILMLMLAQQRYHLPAGALNAILHGTPASADSPTIFEETALEPRVQAGQLDAASAYLPQAIQMNLPYIPLPPAINLGDPSLAAHYASASFRLTSGDVARGKPLVLDITTIGKTDRAAADAFVAYVLSKAGRVEHRQAGYTLLPPTAFGNRGAIPAVIRHELGG